MSSPGENSTPPHVQDLDLDYLVSVFASNVFTSNTTDPKEVQIFDDIQEKCVKLFNKDYIVKIIDNDRGELSATYPNKIVALALPAHSDGNRDGGQVVIFLCIQFFFVFFARGVSGPVVRSIRH
ncbi:hypothetical protein MRX96_056915 [Rhipicephalus microplus]